MHRQQLEELRQPVFWLVDDQSHNHARNQSEVFNWLVIAATKPKDILLVETEDRRKQGLIQDEGGGLHISHISCSGFSNPCFMYHKMKYLWKTIWDIMSLGGMVTLQSTFKTAEGVAMEREVWSPLLTQLPIWPRVRQVSEDVLNVLSKPNAMCPLALYEEYLI